MNNSCKYCGLDFTSFLSKKDIKLHVIECRNSNNKKEKHCTKPPDKQVGVEKQSKKAVSVIWKHFEKFRRPNCKRLFAQCKYCDNQFFGNADRMRVHVIKCKKATEEAKKCIAKDLRQRQKTKAERSNKPVQKNKIFAKDKKRLNMLLSRAFFSAGITFNFVDNRFFRAFLHELRPEFKTITRSQMSGRYLNKEYDHINNLVRQELNKAESITLIVGTKVLERTFKLNILASTPKLVFVKYIELKPELCDAELIGQVLIKVIQQIGPQKIIALVTDYTLKMFSVWELINTSYSHINCFSCAINSLTMHTREILTVPNAELIINNCMRIGTFFKSNKLPVETLDKLSDIRITTKLKSIVVINSLHDILEHKDEILMLASNEDIFKMLFKQTKIDILDMSLWDSIESLYNVLEEINNLINTLQALDPPLLSCVVPALKQIGILLQCMKLAEKYKSKLLSSFQSKVDMIVCGLHYLATLLDPKFKDCLNRQQKEKAFSCGMQLAKQFSLDETRVIRELNDFTDKTGFWKHDVIWKKSKELDTLTWWRTICKDSQLLKLALIALNTTATSVASKINWNSMSGLQAKTRNRMTGIQVEKLMFVMFNLKILNDEDLSEKQIFEKYLSSGSEDDSAEFVRENGVSGKVRDKKPKDTASSSSTKNIGSMENVEENYTFEEETDIDLDPVDCLEEYGNSDEDTDKNRKDIVMSHSIKNFLKDDNKIILEYSGESD